MERTEELALKFAAGEIEDEESRELARLVEDSEHNRNAFVQIMELESLLLATTRVSQADLVVDRLNEERVDRVKRKVMSSISVTLILGNCSSLMRLVTTNSTSSLMAIAARSPAPTTIA